MIGIGAVAAYPRGRCSVFVVGRLEHLPAPDHVETALAAALDAASDHTSSTGFRQAVWRRLRTTLPGLLTITTEWFPPTPSPELR